MTLCLYSIPVLYKILYDTLGAEVPLSVLDGENIRMKISGLWRKAALLLVRFLLLVLKISKAKWVVANAPLDMLVNRLEQFDSHAMQLLQLALGSEDEQQLFAICLGLDLHCTSSETVFLSTVCDGDSQPLPVFKECVSVVQRSSQAHQVVLSTRVRNHCRSLRRWLQQVHLFYCCSMFI
jgi:hypothetical protein